jgi:Putative peptidoglycan binding domain.
MTGTHRFFSDRFHRFNNRTFIFVDTFGFPFFYPYPYYGYYPYDYYGYNDSGYGYGNTVVEVQRRLARAGYYHGAIDGVMGPQTRRAIRAYERDHNQRAYDMINRY